MTRRPPAHCSSPEIAFAERCSDLDLNLDGAIARQPSVAEADPFLSFSSEDLSSMDKEVEDILSGEESDSEGDEQENCWKRDVANDSSSGESMSGDHPRGYKRGREVEEQSQGKVHIVSKSVAWLVSVLFQKCILLYMEMSFSKPISLF